MKKFIPESYTTTIVNGPFSKEWDSPDFDEKYMKVVSHNPDILEYSIIFNLNQTEEYKQKVINQIDEVLIAAGLHGSYTKMIRKTDTVMYMDKNHPMFTEETDE